MCLFAHHLFTWRLCISIISVIQYSFFLFGLGQVDVSCFRGLLTFSLSFGLCLLSTLSFLAFSFCACLVYMRLYMASISFSSLHLCLDSSAFCGWQLHISSSCLNKLPLCGMYSIFYMRVSPWDILHTHSTILMSSCPFFIFFILGRLLLAWLTYLPSSLAVITSSI